MRNVVLLALLTPALLLAQAAPSQASMSLITDKTSLFSGEQVRFQAVARSAQGEIRTGLRFVWSSSDPAIVSVSDGMVTARGVGMARIQASVEGEPGFQAALNVQSVPRRIELTPDNARLVAGESLQFQARALDINNRLIPGVTFAWRAVWDSGSGSEYNTISSSGLLRTASSGRMHITARINLPFLFAGALSLQATVPLVVEPPKHYDFKAIWRSSARAESAVFQLPLLIEDPLRMNDRGQVVFQAALNDQTRAVVMFEDGKFRLLASTGDPSAGRISGRQTITAFGPGSLNENGDFLVQADAQGLFQILMAGGDSARPVFLDGSADGFNPQARRNEPVNLSGPRVARGSLTSDGTAVAWFNTSPLLSRVQSQSFFLIPTRGPLREIVSNRTGLPGLAPGWAINQTHYGINDDLRLYFFAFGQGQQALYSVAPDSTGDQPKVERILGSGDTFLGARVLTVDISSTPASTFTGRNGEFIAGLTLEGQGQVMVRWPSGDTRAAPEVLRPCGCGVFASTRAGTLLRSYGAQGGPGVLLWKRDGSVERVLPVGSTLSNGEIVTAVQGATMNGDGKIFAFVETAQTPATLLSIEGATRQILLRSGDNLPVQPRSALRPMLEGFPASDPVALTSAGSFVRLTSQGPEPQLSLNTRLPVPGNPRFQGIQNDMLAAAIGEDSFVATSAGLFRFKRDGVVETVLPAPITPDGPVIPLLGTPSTSGVHAFYSNSVRGGNTLNQYVPGEPVREILYFGSTTETQPRIDGIQITQFLSRLVVTEDRRVLTWMRAAGAIDVIPLWEDGVWSAIGVANRTRLGGDGQVIVRFEWPRTSANRIFVHAVLADGTMVIAEWNGSVWLPVVSRLNQLPNGTIPVWVGMLAVNTRAEMLISTGEGAMAVRRSDGTFRYLLQRGDSLDGEYGVEILVASLHDDGTVHLLGSNLLGEQIVFRATPRTP